MRRAWARTLICERAGPEKPPVNCRVTANCHTGFISALDSNANSSLSTSYKSDLYKSVPFLRFRRASACRLLFLRCARVPLAPPMCQPVPPSSHSLAPPFPSHSSHPPPSMSLCVHMLPMLPACRLRVTVRAVACPSGAPPLARSTPPAPLLRRAVSSLRVLGHAQTPDLTTKSRTTFHN